MSLSNLFSGALLISMAMVVATIFSSSAGALSEEDVRALTGPISLNIAPGGNNADLLSSRDLELYFGADRNTGMGIKIDNSYTSNLVDESEPAQIGRFRFQF